MSKAQTKRPVQTDNSYPAEKIALRMETLIGGGISSVRVLDCYAGDGKIWKGVGEKSAIKIESYLGIDAKDKSKTILKGKNEKFLPSLNLSKFDVIDLDAYGFPFAQLEILFDRGFKGIVFVTVIQSVMGRVPNGLLKALGYSAAMYEKCPTMFGKDGFAKFLNFLSLRGVKNVRYYSFGRKNYASFSIG